MQSRKLTDREALERNRRWEQERQQQRLSNICYEDMAYRGTPCVCGEHREGDEDKALDI